VREFEREFGFGGFAFLRMKFVFQFTYFIFRFDGHFQKSFGAHQMISRVRR
jgi:hypothetical protein